MTSQKGFVILLVGKGKKREATKMEKTTNFKVKALSNYSFSSGGNLIFEKIYKAESVQKAVYKAAGDAWEWNQSKLNADKITMIIGEHNGDYYGTSLKHWN